MDVAELRAELRAELEPGRMIGRDISRGEAVEHEIDAFISKRHERRVIEEGGRPAQEAWMESERAHNRRRREENTAAWCEYLMDSAARTERVAAEIAAEKRARAQKLMENQPKGAS